MTSRGDSGRCGRGLAGPACLLLGLCVACGSATDAQSALLGQAPRCTEASVLRIEGTIDGHALSDTRTSNINAGLTNFGPSEFQTPLAAELQSHQVELDVSWANSLFDGQVGAITGGILQAPADFPKIRSPEGVYTVNSFCVAKGEVGFVSGGPEDGVFKFAISELWHSDSLNPTVCPSEFPAEGETFAVDVRGCFR